MNAPATHEAVASPIVEYSATTAALHELRTRYAAATYAVQTTAGMREARAARATLRDLRVALEAKRQELKAPILDRGRLLDSEAKRITAELVALEDPIDAQIRGEEDRKAQEKARAEQAERERVAEIDKRIDWIRGRTSEAVRMRTAAEVEVIVRQLAEVPLTEALYAEKLPIATDLHASELAWLRGHAAALAEREAEAARITQEREQIEVEKRAAQERRDREDQARREEQARQDAQRAAKIAQEDAERQVRQRVEDEARAAAARANDELLAAAKKAENERIAAEREAREQQAREAELVERMQRENARRELEALECEADPWSALANIAAEIAGHAGEDAGHVVAVVRVLVKQTLDARARLLAMRGDA